MATLAKEFTQSNLVGIGKAEFMDIKRAIKSNMLLSFSRDAWMGGDRAGWYMKSAPGPDGQYLLIEHYTSAEGGGLAVAHKADKALLEAFRQHAR